MIPYIKKFKREIWDYYNTHIRSLPWRNTKNPYYILVSEVMLQQTQAERVKPYYINFLKQFPTVQKLAHASLSEVLTSWKGLGYNRRASFLKKTAEKIVESGGKFPKKYAELISLPGIGPSTTGAIMNFSYGIPTAFIETNIRTVYIHFFFANKEKVADYEILKVVEETMDHDNPREWFYALYDYGVMLKKTNKSLNSKSKHYHKQSKFKGSNRELRASILFYLLENKRVTVKDLMKYTKKDTNAITKNLKAFIKERVVRETVSKRSTRYFEIV